MLKKNLMKFWREESGASAIEYGLLAALIAVAIIGGATAIGGAVDAKFNEVAGKVLSAGQPAGNP